MVKNTPAKHAFDDGLRRVEPVVALAAVEQELGRSDGDGDEDEADMVERPRRPFSSSPSAASTQVSATRPSGRMRKKVQRQLSRSVTRPPKVGPMIGPITPPTPHIMMMKGCWLRWNEDSRMVWPIGKIGAPNAPCTTRNASSPSSELTRPHSTEVRGEAGHRAGHQRAPA